MITITNLKRVNPQNYDEVWAIVRSLKFKGTMIHVPELSPSWKLFVHYRELVVSGKWNQATFDTEYRPEFMKQIASDRMAQRKLNELIANDASGKRIALVCFCKDVSLCHRSLISEILRNRGVQHMLT